MEQVFSYIISLGASVMMPILFTIIGLCIGMKFGKAFKSGLYVGVGFVGLGVVTALLTSNFNDPLKCISDIYHLQLNVFDMGWPAAAAVAYNTAVGALIIPICLGVNFLMLITKTTRTVNIDLWNYWHFAFIGAVVYFVMGESLVWGYFASIVCYIITLVCADLTAEKFQKHYDLDGISIPQPFCQSFVPFAVILNKALDSIPGFSKLDIDAEGMKKKFGVLGEPLVLGVIVGMLIGWAAQLDIKKVLFLGVTMGAVMELIPRITSLFIEGLKPISEKTQELVKTKFNGKKVYIGMSCSTVHIELGRVLWVLACESDVIRILLCRASNIDTLLEVEVVLLAVYLYNARTADVDDTNLAVLKESLCEQWRDWLKLDRSIGWLGTAHKETVVHRVGPVYLIRSKHLLDEKLLAQTLSCVMLCVLWVISPAYLIVGFLCHCRH